METKYKVEFITDTGHTWEQTFPTGTQAERRAFGMLGAESARGIVVLARTYEYDGIDYVFHDEWEF